ncbi:MAG TPA: YceD family protein, partial [Solirubrobacteraceae bacterium]|nr:YceD family protein [Solirubrobacteraceae bacterium]
KVLCREDCAGLCPVCAADLAEVGPDHSHDRAPDPRWTKLSELKLD